MKKQWMMLALLWASGGQAALVNFGAAESYVMAAGGHSSIILGSSAHLMGNVAAGYYLNLGAGVSVDGDACAPALGMGAGVTVQGKRGCPAGALYESILTASRQLAGLPSSPAFDVTYSTTLQAGTYQLGSLLLGAGEFLTLKGGAADTMVVNVMGAAKLGSGAGILLTGGLKASNVYFNFINTAQYSSFEFGAATLSGTFVSDGRSFIMGDGATLNNTRFFTNSNIVANVQTVRYDSSENEEFPIVPPVDITSVSAPMGMSVLLLGWALWGRRSQRKFFERQTVD